ncbi:hypothetical protein D9613_011496 [Agrocybe pediades]|uniref:Uncharacterized protein n=1 Tax=Agrocybe pediades TaxID=84607 RepID=A0A8H4VN23_9AGAR|nr:hypothetical protein D9613_011496 [Agrocybe pediades]
MPRATEKHVWVHRQKPALPDFASINQLCIHSSDFGKTFIFSTNQYLKHVQPFDFGRLLGNPKPFIPPIHPVIRSAKIELANYTTMYHLPARVPRATLLFTHIHNPTASFQAGRSGYWNEVLGENFYELLRPLTTFYDLLRPFTTFYELLRPLTTSHEILRNFTTLLRPARIFMASTNFYYIYESTNFYDIYEFTTFNDLGLWANPEFWGELKMKFLCTLRCKVLYIYFEWTLEFILYFIKHNLVVSDEPTPSWEFDLGSWNFEAMYRK